MSVNKNDSSAASQVLLALREHWLSLHRLPRNIAHGDFILAKITMLSDEHRNLDAGVGRLMPFLENETRLRLTEIAAKAPTTPIGVAQAHILISKCVMEEGRRLAMEHGFDYPEDLERTVMHYVRTELGLLGIKVC